MALQVWMPLNGNLNNQGLCSTTITNGGATSNSVGKIGGCYSFNGSSNYITVTKAIPSLEFSFGGWYKFNNISVNGCLATCRSVVGNGIALFELNNGRIRFDVGSVGSETSVVITAGKWHHVFATYDGKVKHVYVDGSLVQSENKVLSSIQSLNSYGWSIGASQGSDTLVGNSNYLNGYANDFRMYNHALSPKEVKEISKGLVVHYKLDSLNTSVNNKVCDCSGYKNNGTIIGTLTVASDSPRYNKSSVFDGTTSAIEIVSPNIFPSVLNNDFAISMWIYNNDGGGRSIFFGNYGLTGSYFNIEKKTDEKVRFYWSGKPDLTLNNCTLTASAWSHLVITRSGNTVKGYVNGVLKDTSTTTLQDTIPEGATTFRIGRDNRADTTMFKGNISDFRIYATVLSDNNIKELYDTSAYVYNDGTLASYEFVEEEITPEIFKNGVAKCTNVSEYSDDMKVLEDGSTFVKLLHHNNPASNLFTQDNCWNNNSDNLFSALGLLKADNLVNSAGEYEFLVCEKLTSGETESQCRWKQTSNPAISSTLTGYQLISGAPPRSVGLMNKGSYGCFHNGGSWWCCCGSYSVYSGGIPGFFGIVTTGYLDLYIRIPDVKMLNDNKAIFHINNIQTNQLIEI